MSNEPQKVIFTRNQLELLEQMFPERVLGSAHSEAELRFYFGQRSVVQFIRERLNGRRG